MATKKIYKIFTLLVFASLLMGQAEHKTKQQLMDELLAEKLEKYHKVNLRQCEEKVQKRAQAIVDSLLLEVAKVKTVDPFKRPPTPPKPPKPKVKVAKDTTDVKPLFEN